MIEQYTSRSQGVQVNILLIKSLTLYFRYNNVEKFGDLEVLNLKMLTSVQTVHEQAGSSIQNCIASS